MNPSSIYYKIIKNTSFPAFISVTNKLDLSNENDFNYFTMSISSGNEVLKLCIKPPSGESVTFFPDHSFRICRINNEIFLFQAYDELMKLQVNNENNPYIFTFSDPNIYSSQKESLIERSSNFPICKILKAVRDKQEEPVNFSFDFVELYGFKFLKNWKNDLLSLIKEPTRIFYKLSDVWVEVDLDTNGIILNESDLELFNDNNSNKFFKEKDSNNGIAAQNYMEFTLASVVYNSIPYQDSVTKSFSAYMSESGLENSKLLLRNFSVCVNKYYLSKTYAPYVAVCQSSGFGKSRVTMECGKRLISIYAVFRKFERSGFPEQAGWISEFVTDVNNAVEDDFPTTSNVNLDRYKVGRALANIDIIMEGFKVFFKDLIIQSFGCKIFKDHVNNLNISALLIQLNFLNTMVDSSDLDFSKNLGSFLASLPNLETMESDKKLEFLEKLDDFLMQAKLKIISITDSRFIEQLNLRAEFPGNKIKSIYDAGYYYKLNVLLHIPDKSTEITDHNFYNKLKFVQGLNNILNYVKEKLIGLSDSTFFAHLLALVTNSKVFTEKLSTIFDEINECFKSKSSDLQISFNKFIGKIRDQRRNGSYYDYLTTDDAAKSIINNAQLFVPFNRIISEFKDEKEYGENGEKTLDPEHDSFPFLFILDEFATMRNFESTNRISFFTALRRALHYLNPPTTAEKKANPTLKFPILFVALGTNCDISILSKTVEDSSLRFPDRSELHFPMIFPGSWDILYHETELPKLVVDASLLKNELTFWLLVSLGRALWSSIDITNLFSLSYQKLDNGSNGSDTPFMASWCIRSGLTVNADQVLAEKLVRSHMATLFSVSPLDRKIYVGYSSEPVLAMTSREFVNDYPAKRMFRALLNLIERVPINKGKITEAIFTEILLRGIDKSPRINQFEINYEPKGGNETVKNLYKTRSFILEHFLNEPKESGNSQAPVTSFRYHVTTVSKFVKTVFKSEIIDEFIPEKLKNGLINASQFIQLRRKFPYQTDIPDSEDSNSYDELAGGNLKLHCNVIDKGLLQLGLLRQCAFTMPEGYYGIDSIIPVAVEYEDEKENATVKTSKKTFLTFIAIQSEDGEADPMDTLMKMNPSSHIQRDGFNDEEWEFLVKNYLVLVVSAKNDSDRPVDDASPTKSLSKGSVYNSSRVITKTEKVPFLKNLFPTNCSRLFTHLSVANIHVLSKKIDSHQIIKPKPMKKNPNFPGKRSASQSLRKSARLGAIEQSKSESDAESESDADAEFEFESESESEVLNPSSYGEYRINGDLSISQMNWNRSNLNCIWSNSLNVFLNLLDLEAIALAKSVIYHDIDPISGAHVSQRKSVGDAFLTMSTATYPGSDHYLREVRGHVQIPRCLDTFEHWKHRNNNN